MKKVTNGDKVKKRKVVNGEEDEFEMIDDASDSSLAEIIAIFLKTFLWKLHICM